MTESIVVVGAGCVGGGFARALREMDPGARITLTTRTESSRDAWRSEGFEAECLDVLGPPAWPRALGEASLAIVSVAAGRGEGSERVYGEGIPRWIASMDSRTRVVYTSSIGVYAEDSGRWVDEDAPRDRASERGRALVAAEDAVLEGRANTVLRLSGLLEVGRGPHRFAPSLAGTRRDDGWLNLVEVDDVVKALLQIARVELPGVFHLSAPPLLRSEFYDPILRAVGAEPVAWTGEASQRGRRVCMERFERAMGWAPPRIDLAPYLRGAGS